MAGFRPFQSVLSTLFTFFALASLVSASQHAVHNHGRRDVEAAMLAQMGQVAEALDERQAQGRLAVTGACDASAQSNDACNSNGRTTAARREIRDLATDADLWNLFLLGMERFQAKDKSDVLSYYQIAGIHGRPYVTWNGFPAPLVNRAGFCPHAMTLFGSWHRPYLAVFEQALYQSVLEVVSTFPSSQQQKMRHLASLLRAPYWDWAEGDGVPSLISDQKVTVTKPSGQVQIDNPLYSYSWGSQLPSEMGGGPLNGYPRTLRRPISGTTPPTSNDQNLHQIIRSMQPNLRDRIFALFSSGQAWGSVSTEAIGIKTSTSNMDSIESLHDAIHSTFGGGDDGGESGHMALLDYSAFDPVFWLHHVNIDRLLAMYQMMSPDTWVANGNVNYPMAQWNVGEPKNAYTPLKPFTKDVSGNYFTSADVRETRILGYFYPETEQRARQQVIDKINSYRGDKQALQKRVDSADGSSLHGRPIKAGEFNTILEVIANKYAVRGSYAVHAYVGEQKPASSVQNRSSTVTPGSKPSSTSAPYHNTTSQGTFEYYTMQSNYVGSCGILGHSMGSMGNGSVMIGGSISLTSCLQSKQADGELGSLTPEDIEPYLQEKLYYKLVGPGGEMDADSVEGLHISVKCNAAVPAPNDSSLPDLSAPYQSLARCTEGKPAGQPFIYTPQPIDVPLPSNATSSAYGSLPWQEAGYCAMTNQIVYVDPSGTILSQ